jgi:hypothetical protein
VQVPTIYEGYRGLGIMTTTTREAAAEIKKTLQYMNSKEYRDVVATAQKELKNLTNRDIKFFNMGKECDRRYVLRVIDEKMQELKAELNNIKK